MELKLITGLNNIEWASDLSNQRHAWDSGLKDGVLYKLRKYPWSLVVELRERHANGERLSEIADSYGMDRALCRRIALKENYVREIDPLIPTERLARPSLG